MPDPDEQFATPMWTMALDGSTPGALVEVRRWTAAELADLGAQHLSDVLLVAVELVTNAYDHGGGPIAVRMNRAHEPCSIGIEVEDSNSEPLTLGQSRFTQQTRGRGLIVVDKLAHKWGVRTHPETGGKAVWAHIPCGTYPCGVR